MARVVLIPADPQDAIRDVEVPDVRLENLQRLIGGGYIERVTSGPLRDSASSEDNLPVMVVDEEGRLKHLRYNERATILYVPAASRQMHWIAGDAIVVGEGMTPEGPDFIDLPEDAGARTISDLIEHYRGI